MESRVCYCLNCDADVEARIENRIEEFPVRGAATKVQSRVAVCSVCDEDLFDEDLDAENLEAAYAAYRREHGFVTSEELADMRAVYGLSQKAFSLLLGWGEIQVHRYESGSLQTAAHDALLQLAREPENARRLLAINGESLSAKQRDELAQRLDRLSDEEPEAKTAGVLLSLSHTTPSANNGYRRLDASKVREMIVYFAECRDMYVTKLAKMLFYSDFLHFKEYTTSISGLRYCHLPYGPVPENYDLVRADASAAGIIGYEERLGPDWSGDVVLATREPDLAVFTSDEAYVLEVVASRLAGKTSKFISEMSHAEDAYASTQMGQVISYEAAQSLSIST